MTWQQYPKDIELPTPLGPVWLAITDGNHIYVDANSNEKYLTVNGVKLCVSLHLHRRSDGTWGTQSSDSVHARRLDWTNYNQSHASSAACKKILATIIPLVDDFMDNNEDLRRQAAEADRNNRAERVLTTIADLEEQLAKARDELDAIAKEA
jgi:hypothetical protein